MIYNKNDEYEDYELIINEIFGPTIQGEGYNVGKICMFIRLQGCDQSPPCKWCDTMNAYNIDNKNRKIMKFKEIFEVINKINLYKHVFDIVDEKTEKNKSKVDLFRIIITGGNPCLQDNIYEFVKYLRRQINNLEIFLETQGTIINENISEFDYITFSPKPPSSNIYHKGQDITNIVNFLKKYSDKAEVKIVVFNEKDLEYVTQCFKLIEYKDTINYTIQIGTECNSIKSEIDANKVMNYLYHAEDILPFEIIKKLRILPQVHNILKVK